MYYSAIGLLAVIILLIENRDILLNRSGAFELPAWKVYRKFLFAVLVYYITDILWGILESRRLAAALFADTTIYFVAMAVGVLFWAQYTVASPIWTRREASAVSSYLSADSLPG